MISIPLHRLPRLISPRPEEGEEGEVVAVKSDTFLAFLDYFRRENRVATINADPYHTADNKEEGDDDDYGWSKSEDDSGSWGNNCGDDDGQDKEKDESFTNQPRDEVEYNHWLKSLTTSDISASESELYSHENSTIVFV